MTARALVVVGLLLIGGRLAEPGEALSPPHHYHDLVAGGGERGFRDGAFYEARFDRPSGLTIDPDGRRLFVADTGNRRIRAVRLDDGNRVETVAGSGLSGWDDGPALAATFRAPSALAWVSDERLAVADGGRIRLVDLARKTVKTVVGAGGEADQSPIWSVLYVPGESALYFTQPDIGALRRLEFASGRVDTLSGFEKVLIQPGNLCLFRGAVIVTERSSGNIYRLTVATGDAGGPNLQTQLVDRADRVVALTASGDRLYAIRSGASPWVRLAPLETIPFMTAFGEFFDAPAIGEIPGDSPSPAAGAVRPAAGNATKIVPPPIMPIPPFLEVDGANPAGFIADPREERRFFTAQTTKDCIVSLRDRYFVDLSDARRNLQNGLSDFHYAMQKPANTVRILLVGDSHLRDTAPDWDAPSGAAGPVLKWNRMNTLPKKLELLLAVDGALEDRPVGYEVLAIDRIVTNQLLVWPYYKVPEIVKTYEIDLVLFVVPAAPGLLAYFETPLTELGIPGIVPDPEYLLKPDVEKLSDPALRRLYDACTARQLAMQHPNGRIVFAPLEDLMRQAEIRTELAELIGRPFRLLDRALRRDRGSPLYVVYIPVGEKDPVQPFADLLGDIARRDGLKVIDMSNTMVTLRKTLYGYNELAGNYHLRPGGHDMAAHLLAREIKTLVGKR